MEVRSRQDAKSVCIKSRHGAMSAGELLEEDCSVCYVKAVALIGLRGCGRGEHEEEEGDLSLRRRYLRQVRGWLCSYGRLA